MIIKVQFKSPDEEFTMLFGDSYKKWQQQYAEFVRRYTGGYEKRHELEVVRVFRCNDKWKGWGGLKWCEDTSFQHELNREGCQTDDPDNPNARQYSDMKFYEFDMREFDRLVSKYI